MSKSYSIQYCDANSILIINKQGKMKRLYTPFKVAVVESIDGLQEGTLVYVEEVASSNTVGLTYITNQGAYPHKHFRITASF